MNNFKRWLEHNEKYIAPQSPWGFGGWKIHLGTGPDEDVRDRAYKIVQEIIAQNDIKWPSKKLGGGEADEKDITIYCGPKSEADKAAFAISNHPELSKLLLPPGNDILQDDVEILPDTGVYGRFNASLLQSKTGTEYHQYGCKGHSMLNSRMGMIRQPNFDKNAACIDSYRHLKNKIGADFTDKNIFGYSDKEGHPLP